MPAHIPPKAAKPKDDGRLWERFEDETEKQFLAFKSYRDLAPIDRTALEAYRRYTAKPLARNANEWWYGMAHRNRWKERAAAFDAYLDRMQCEAETDERLKARKLRRAVLLTTMKALGTAIKENNGKAGIDFAKASVGDFARSLDVVARNLREEYADIAPVRSDVTLINGGSSELAKLADRAAVLSDVDAVAEFRRLTGTPSKALSDGTVTDDDSQPDGDGEADAG